LFVRSGANPHTRPLPRPHDPPLSGSRPSAPTDQLTAGRFSRPSVRAHRRGGRAEPSTSQRPQLVRTVGVIGGMGPAATADFFRRLVASTEANRDQDHLHVIIDSDPSVPDRTAYLRHCGPDPRPQLMRIAHRLVAAGADLLVMPCNTAHVFFESLQASIAVELIDWIEEAVAHIRERWDGGAIGLLATDGTVRTRLYQSRFERAAISVITPSARSQRELTAIIYGIKSGGPTVALARRLEAVAEELIDREANGLLLACTELSLLAAEQELVCKRPIFDAAAIVAEAVIARAGAQRTARPSRPDADG
jgi:aspartate racemase